MEWLRGNLNGPPSKSDCPVLWYSIHTKTRTEWNEWSDPPTPAPGRTRIKYPWLPAMDGMEKPRPEPQTQNQAVSNWKRFKIHDHHILVGGVTHS